MIKERMEERPAGVRWGRVKGTPNKATARVKEVAQALTLGNAKVIARLKTECESGKVEPAIFNRLLEYGYGRPKFVLELEAPPSEAGELARVLQSSLTSEERMQMYALTSKAIAMAGATVIDMKALPEARKAVRRRVKAKVAAEVKA